MPWITHISRSATDGELLCNTQDLDGTRQVLPVCQLPYRTMQRTHSLHFVQVDSAHHEVADVSEYLSAMGWTSLPAHGQTLHKFFTSAGEFWVPSQLLVRALFAVMAPMAKNVFTPRPLTTFCRPVLDSSDNQIAPSKGQPFISSNYLRQQNTRQRLSWLAHSKSARGAWASVYRNARDGLLDCAMPEGVFEFCFGAVRRSNVLCVTRANLRRVTCNDIFTRQCSEPQTFTFGKDLKYPSSETWKPRSKKTRRTPERGNIKRLELSDEKFETIRALLEERKVMRRNGKHSSDLPNLRSQLNLIHTKSVYGCRWVDVCADAKEIWNAKVRLARYKRGNHWGDIQAILLQEDSIAVG